MPATPGTISLCAVMAYVLGHLVATLSRFVIEHTFVRGCLRAPEDTLFASELTASQNWKQFLFPNYYQPLPEQVRDQVMQKAGRAGLNEPDRALLHATAVVEDEVIELPKTA